MFNACDVNDDSRVEIGELKKFVEGLSGSGEFKIKEVYSLMNYLDIDKNGIIDKDEFLR
jgi:Ca2+-binding EF-hand superfamily protein